jgi:hypothetical protein
LNLKIKNEVTGKILLTCPGILYFVLLFSEKTMIDEKAGKSRRNHEINYQSA